MPDHSEDDTPHSPIYQWGCPAGGCTGVLMWLPGQGCSVCMSCGANCRREDGLLYDITVDPPRLLSSDEVTALGSRD